MTSLHRPVLRAAASARSDSSLRAPVHKRVNIYLPKSLIVRADKKAVEFGMSRSSFLGFAVTTAIGWQTSGVKFSEIDGPRSKVRVARTKAGAKASPKLRGR